MDDIAFTIDHVTLNLVTLNEDLAPLLNKLSEAPVPDLTIEERVLLRHHLLTLHSQVRLLDNAAADASIINARRTLRHPFKKK